MDFNTILERRKFKLMYASYEFLRREWFDRRNLPVDGFCSVATRKDRIFGQYREIFFSKDYAEIFDFVQFIMRDKDCPEGLVEGFCKEINAPGHPYSVIGPPWTIVPRVSEDERESLQASLETVQESEFSGARKHIEFAMTALSGGDASGSIRESIHAIESIVKQMLGDEATTLPPALKRLQKNGLGFHPALEIAVSKLYGYTSDEKGIRHALLDDETQNVGEDEAIFMLGACASFAALLAKKHEAMTAGEKLLES